jgi:hypothetical protein
MSLHLHHDLVTVPEYVNSFLDTVAVAQTFEQYFGRAHCALILNEYGEVLDFCVLTDDDDSVRDAAMWAHDVKRLGGFESESAAVVLFSTEDSGAVEASPADVAVLDQLRARLATVALFLRDWVKVDGDLARSVTDVDTQPIQLPRWPTAADASDDSGSMFEIGPGRLTAELESETEGSGSWALTPSTLPVAEFAA